MPYKIKLSESIMLRIKDYINSNYYKVEDKYLTAHWDNWIKKEQIIIKDNNILIEKTNDKTKLQQGFDTDYLSNFTKTPSYKVSLKQILSSEARLRLNNVRMVKPELANLVENYLIGLSAQGKAQGQITDQQLKQILLSAQQPKREFKINRV